MNVNIYLEDTLAKTLAHYAKETGKARNAIIREALKEWILRHQVKQWPSSILNFKGAAEAPAFESFRDELLPPDEDIFK